MAQTFHFSPTPSEHTTYKGGAGDKSANCVRGNGSGLNGVTVGHFNNTTNFGPYNEGVFNINRTSNGGDDIFILERHAESGLNWIQTIGGPGNDQALSVTKANYTDFVIVGFFSETVDFNPDPIITVNRTATGGRDIFVLSLTSTGDFNWVYTMGGLGDDWANSVAYGDGSVYVTGTFEQTLSYPIGGMFYGALPSKGGTDAFVAKFDVTTGAVGFVESMGGEYDDYGDYVQAEWDKIYLTGMFHGTADVDPGIGTYDLVADAADPSLDAIYNVRIDDTGNLIWADKIVGSLPNSLSGAISGCGPSSVYVVGTASGMTDVDPGPGTYWINPIGPGSSKVGFLLKKDAATGALIWARVFNCLGDIELTDVFTINSAYGEHVFVSGIFEQNASLQTAGGFFETVSTPAEGSFVASYDWTGTVTNHRAVDHTQIRSLCAWHHACTPAKHSWVEFCGSYTNTVDFSDYPAVPLVETNVGGRDGVTVTWLGECYAGFKSSQKTAGIEDLNQELDVEVYPNPTEGIVTIKLGENESASYQILNSLGAVVYAGKISGTEQLDLSELSSGLYAVSVVAGEKVVSKKLIVQ
ncbi:MAG: T9SS type A sorting domain-containing protein [Flavobacteriales bacterium]|nr:T9SS type A sorting domain-containing protein [Flavobacteriales bacterium]